MDSFLQTERSALPRYRLLNAACRGLLMLVPMVGWSASAMAADGGNTSGGAQGAGASTSATGSASDATGTSGSGSAASLPGSDIGFGLGSGLGFQPGLGRGCAGRNGPGLTSIGQPGVAPALVNPRGPANANGRYVSASVSGLETYTDNLNRDRDSEAVSDFITSVAPQVNACSEYGRIRGELNYQLQGVVYANNSQFNDVYNDVAGQTTVDVISNHLFLDADTRYGQRVIDPSISYSQGNVLRPSDNSTTTWTSNVSPYLVQSLGPLGTGQLRYRYGRSENFDDDVPNNEVNGVSGAIVSPDTAEPLSWQFSALTQKVTTTGGNRARFFNGLLDDGDNSDLFDESGNDQSRTSYFDQATAELGYRLTSTLKLIGSAGVEDRYQDDGTNDRFSSPLYNGGVQWSTARNSVEARFGHRFYGTTYQLNADHRGQFYTAHIDYSENPSTQGLNSLNGGGGFGSFGGLGGSSGGFNSGGGLGGNATDENGPASSLFDRGVFVEKRWTADVTFNTALTETTIRGYRQLREYQESGFGDETYRGIDVTSRYDFTRRMSVVPQARWSNRSGGGGGNDGGRGLGAGFDSYDAGLTLVRAVSPTAQAGVGYARSWRNGEVASSDYHENTVTLQFIKSF